MMRSPAEAFMETPPTVTTTTTTKKNICCMTPPTVENVPKGWQTGAEQTTRQG